MYGIKSTIIFGKLLEQKWNVSNTYSSVYDQKQISYFWELFIFQTIKHLSFCQYIENKKHRYGIKIFKLCINDGYTVGFKICTGQESIQEVLTERRSTIWDNFWQDMVASRTTSTGLHGLITLECVSCGDPEDDVEHTFFSCGR